MKVLMKDATARQLQDSLERELPALLVRAHVPGLSLTLVRDAEIFWNYALGVQRSDAPQPVGVDTLFEAASLSKPVFAYMVLKLCEAQVLDLDIPLVKYLPEPYLPDEPRLRLITARHVLSHSTGFPNWRPRGEPLRIYFNPGERFSYSGEGYMYLQAVLAHLVSQEPATYMKTHLLRPLGMQQSCFIWNGQSDWPVAVGHDEKGDVMKKRLWEKMFAAASLHCPARDLGKLLSVIMRPSAENPTHLSAELTEEMLTAQISVNDSAPWAADWPRVEIKTHEFVSWGLGWGLQRTALGESFWHWGDNGNYRAFAVGLRGEGVGMVIMTNGRNGQQVINYILRDIVGGEYPGLDWLNSLS